MELLPIACVVSAPVHRLSIEAIMNTRSKAASNSEEIAAIQELMSDLEKRLNRLTGSAKREISGGSADINEFVNDALNGIMGRVREGAHNVSQSVADKATDCETLC